MIQLVKQTRKRWKRNKFLKQIVAAYDNPWAKITKTLTDVNYNEHLYLNSLKRFDKDRIGLSRLLITNEICALHKRLLNVLWSDSAEDEICTDELMKEVKTMLTQGMQVYSCSDFNTPTEASENKHWLVEQLLNQILDEDLLVYCFNIDFLDDIVPIVESRYITLQGLTDKDKSERILKCLWLASGGNIEEEIYTVKSELPTKLKEYLGEEHQYSPTAVFFEPSNSFYQSHQPKYQKLLSLNKTKDVTQSVDIWADIFVDLNSKMSKNAEDRNISLVHGYENNYHVILRTIMALMKKGLLHKDDPVLVLGPRFVDEIVFLRKYVGLKNAVGLDLRDEGDMIIKGDMHSMPFEDGRFKLVYGANVFEYAYNIRKVTDEIVRVLDKPGYAMGILRTVRQTPDIPPIGTDISTPEAAVNMFYQYPHTVLAMDSGYSAASTLKDGFPSFALRIEAGN